MIAGRVAPAAVEVVTAALRTSDTTRTGRRPASRRARGNASPRSIRSRMPPSCRSGPYLLRPSPAAYPVTMPGRQRDPSGSRATVTRWLSSPASIPRDGRGAGWSSISTASDGRRCPAAGSQSVRSSRGGRSPERSARRSRPSSHGAWAGFSAWCRSTAAPDLARSSHGGSTATGCHHASSSTRSRRSKGPASSTTGRSRPRSPRRCGAAGTARAASGMPSRGAASGRSSSSQSTRATSSSSRAPCRRSGGGTSTTTRRR